MPSVPVLVLGCLFVSFRPSLIRSHSCSSGAALLLSPPGCPHPLGFLSSSLLPVPATQPLLLPFRSTRPRLAVASPVRSLRFRFLSSPRSLRPDFSCLPSRFSYLALLFVSFRPSLIRSHSCSSGAALLLSPPGCPHPLGFLSSALLPVPATQPSVLSFPFFPVSPDGGSSGAVFLFRPACCHALRPIPVLSFLFFLSPLAVSPRSGYLSASAFDLSASGFLPLAFALGSGYLALGCVIW